MDKILKNFQGGIKAGLEASYERANEIEKVLSIDDGGPAYPTDIRFQHSNECPRSNHEYGFHGMRLRDMFAGMALQGMLAYTGGMKSGSCHDNCTPKGASESAYKYADAMLKARQP